MAQDGTTTSVGVLNIENGIVAGLLQRFSQIKIEWRVAFTRQHNKAHDIGAHFINDVAQGDEIA